MGKDVLIESVPSFNSRVGDVVFHGPNNSMILLGADRVSSVNSGFAGTTGAGSIHIVAGRKGEDISTKDSAFMYLSMKNDVDGNLGLGSIEFSSSGPSAAMVADHVRLVARKDIKISANGSYITLKSDGSIVIDGIIKLGTTAFESLILGETFSLIFAAHTHTTPVGVTSPPVPDPNFTARRHLSKKSKTE